MKTCVITLLCCSILSFKAMTQEHTPEYKTAEQQERISQLCDDMIHHPIDFNIEQLNELLELPLSKEQLRYYTFELFEHGSTCKLCWQHSFIGFSLNNSVFYIVFLIRQYGE